ncbi:DNA primase [Nocardioides alcanivorans]|uniref:DNA primase n=1 Tax=Nocardioides alcanivorans TaxID=2897352 RepID=UPI001F165A7E|nr:DNA primase [Nocardioides alcanivorans]
MAGRIREDDIAEVREKARIDEVVSAYVTLRNAGGGSMKGLCPFHDEKSPSFNVNPSRQFFHCFGCGEGGDVFSFLMKIDGLGFSEAVERLAEQFNVELRRVDGDDGPQQRKGPQRSKLISANRMAQEFYAAQLTTPDALAARQFLAGRGFDKEVADVFGIGFAPRSGEALHKHLRQGGFTDEELVVAGLVGQSSRGHYDRFRGRLLWPIRDSAGDTIGFGARRLFDDDRIEAKYLNTPETPLYKKSQVLYGIDLARTEIDRTTRAVIVEGYTDVMACHVAGVKTAVASCGTAFGDDHAKLLRRFLDHQKGGQGEVIFTFDGDAAGQKAAMKAFEGDHNFLAQTYVAVEASGLDPCDLRLEKGDEAIRELIEGRVPLYRFVLGNVLARFDLDRADSRVDALREAAGLVHSVRDKTKVEAFTRELASSIGVDIDEARREVNKAARRPKGQPQVTLRRTPEAPAVEEKPKPRALPMPDPRDPRITLERETIKLVLHHADVVSRIADPLTPEEFQHPAYRVLWTQIVAAGGASAAHPGWVAELRDTATDPTVARLVVALSVEPIRSSKEPDAAFVRSFVSRLQEMAVARRIADLTSKLQRSDPSGPDYQQVSASLMEAERRRRSLREVSMGLQ